MNSLSVDGSWWPVAGQETSTRRQSHPDSSPSNFSFCGEFWYILDLYLKGLNILLYVKRQMLFGSQQHNKTGIFCGCFNFNSVHRPRKEIMGPNLHSHRLINL